MSNAPPIQHRKLWEERSVAVSLVLAILVPGLGHLFQGRTFKGLIYLFGILGLFVWGVYLGDGIVVYNLPERGLTRRFTLHFAAQWGAGIISYPALWQKQRMTRPENHPVRQLDKPLTASFSGELKSTRDDADEGKLEGTVRLEPASGEYHTETQGTFKGTLDGKPIELKLSGIDSLDRPISAGFRRGLRCSVAGAKDDLPGASQIIVGTIPRSIMDSYGVPPDPDQLQEVTGRLGKLHELALVFTWIAGLLNILAIWDCVQGPAYGFGDEPATAPVQDNTGDSAKLANQPPANKTVSTA